MLHSNIRCEILGSYLLNLASAALLPSWSNHSAIYLFAWPLLILLLTLFTAGTITQETLLNQLSAGEVLGDDFDVEEEIEGTQSGGLTESEPPEEPDPEPEDEEEEAPEEE